MGIYRRYCATSRWPSTKPLPITCKNPHSNHTINNNSFKENKITNIVGKKILLLTQNISKQQSKNKVPVDILIVSNNPCIYINQLQLAFDCKIIDLDCNNPLWKIQLWKKDCDNLHLRFHSTPENGAFVMDL